MLASTPLILRKSRMRRRARTDLCGGRSVMVVPTATVTVDNMFSLIGNWPIPIYERGRLRRNIHSPLVTSDLARSSDLSQHCPARGGADVSSDAERNESYLFCAQDFAPKLLSPIDQPEFSL